MESVGREDIKSTQGPTTSTIINAPLKRKFTEWYVPDQKHNFEHLKRRIANEKQFNELYSGWKWNATDGLRSWVFV